MTDIAATCLRWMATNHPTDLTDAERAAALTDRITRALAALQAAPDTLGDDASKRHARDVAFANRVAWAILSEGWVPESVRHAAPTGGEGV